MRKIVCFLVACLFVFGGWASAFAGWDGTNWGIGLAEFESKIGMKLTSLGNSKFGLAKDITFFGYQFSLFANFPDGKLKDVAFVKKGGAASSACTDIFKQLDTRHPQILGKEEAQSEYIFLWQDGDTDIFGSLQMPDFGEHQCIIIYMPEKSMFPR